MPERSSFPGNPFTRRHVARLTATAVLAGTMASVTSTPPQRRASASTGPVRRRQSLNPKWRFAGPLRNPGDAPRYSGRFEEVDLPHTVAELSWREWNPADWEGFWLYRKEFDLPGADGSARFLLRFAGGMTATRPWLNGRALPEYVGGYLPFEYEITDHVREQGNRLDVVVDGRFDINTPPNRPGKPANSVDLWQPAGLYRDVTLEMVPANYLADVFARPRAVLEPGNRSIDVRATVDVAAPRTDAELTLELYDDGVPIASETAPLALDRPGRATISTTLRGLPDITLWSTGNPKLYRLVVTLSIAGRPVHDYLVNVGFRQAEFTERGFFLNGERLQLFGSGRHHYFPYTGSAMPARVQYQDVRILKRHGHNMVRCTVYPQDESFLDACDELGLLVYDEAPGWGYLGDADWLDRSARDVREMILRDRNHPSIVLWGARLNETPNNTEFYTRTQAIARELDASRQTTGAMIFNMHGTTDFQQDVFSYNDYAKRPDARYPQLRPPRTDRPYLVSEAVGTLSGPAKFYRRTDPVVDQHGQAVAHAMVHDQAAGDQRYCGALGWSSYDYQSGHGNQRSGIKSTGIFDMFREPKLGAAIYTAQVDPARHPVIEPAFYWDFDGEFSVHNLGAEAMICSNADRLELFVDGRDFATLHPARERFPNLRFAPFLADFRSVDATREPELRVDAYRNDLPIGSRTFSSARARDRLQARADDDTLVANGSDATRVVFRVVDEHGAPRPARSGNLRLVLDGPAILLGDNPFPLGEVGGVGAVWLRTRYGRTGEAELRVEHDTLDPQRVRVLVRGEQPDEHQP
ncbi:MAG: beta-galactosidase [Pseudonocardiaceae bacterium]|nr:beta-galactosidase [Pseudonocardiaceae bacterium]